MNAVEIEEAVSELVLQPFDATEFPFQFITAFGAKNSTVERLRKGDTNQSDVGGVLQRNNIHIGIASAGEVGDTLARLRASPKTTSVKAKFILATDGEWVEAEEVGGGDPIACAYADLPRYFAMFLPLAGISTVKEIKNNPIDVKATGRLNKLYVELLKDNPDWATEDRRHELNQFMARLIFCFFAEDTGIFREHQFTATITQMSHAGHSSGEKQWGNTHEVLTELFRAMDTPVTHEGNLDPRYREAANIRPYADVFPYVNGGLFTGAVDAPRFSRTARAYLLRAGELDWKEINPDIFGSMIQAVAEDDERGELGMHYTSVPNILKVLNPLFLDDLRDQLEAAGDSKLKLRNLRKRLGSIRVFDPACGSGNFLVIAYKEMRAIEAQVVDRLGGEASLKLSERRSVISLSNFYGIEIKGFAAEIARLALLIAEFQADCRYLSQHEARAMVLPLHKTGQITVGNALRLDWLTVCPPVYAATGGEHDLGSPPGQPALELNALGAQVDYEVFICGNPPYKGARYQSEQQKADIAHVYSVLNQPAAKAIDYIACWYLLASKFLSASTRSQFAFVSTNSICQGQQVPSLWPVVFGYGLEIFFAYTSFPWRNLASHNAAVIVVIVGVRRTSGEICTLYSLEDSSELVEARVVGSINPYLSPGARLIVQGRSSPLSDLSPMETGGMARDNNEFTISRDDYNELVFREPECLPLFRQAYGGAEFIRGLDRIVFYLRTGEKLTDRQSHALKSMLDRVRTYREDSTRPETRRIANRPEYFSEDRHYEGVKIFVPQVFSENRDYITAGFLRPSDLVLGPGMQVIRGQLTDLALLTSLLHLKWVETVCGKLKTDIRYSNTMGWNTFPVPKLTEGNKADLTRTAENILLAREAHFPATIADLYDPDNMPVDLRRAHEENDEVLERIYIGRRFRNDTERLEKLFDLYAKMTANQPAKANGVKKGKVA